MQENFLHFLSDVPSNLECNGKGFGFIDNESIFELDLITKTNHIFINYIPISQSHQSIPYTFKLDTENTPTTDNEYIKVVPFPSNHYDIIMKPFYYYQISDSEVLFNGNIDRYFISITNTAQTNISIFSGNTIIFNKTTQKLNNVKVEKKEAMISIIGIIDDNNYLLLIIDTNNFHILYEDIIQSIDNNQSSISTYKKSNTLCQYAKVCKFNFSSKESENYYVYDNNNTQDTQIHTLLIPQALLECVQISDEGMCISFLNSKYQNTTIKQLKDYFGEIQEIYLNRHQINPSKINYTIKANNKFRNFNFLMDNNKIYDIEEIF